MTDQRPDFIPAALRSAADRKAAADRARLTQIAHDLRDMAKDLDHWKASKRLDKAANKIDAAIAALEGRDEE
jgi:nitrate reductase assembly molybdenum cofactor insertion protein NarJ